MDVDLVPMILHLIEEVLDFKAYIESSICEGKNAIVGYTKT